MFLLTFCIASQTFGALPPLYQSLKELKAVLESPELSNKLTSADYIEEIRRTDEGFLIKTNKHTIQAKLVVEPQGMPGPTKFHVIFEEPKRTKLFSQCLKMGAVILY